MNIIDHEKKRYGNVKNIIYILLLSFLVAGCSVMSQGWRNFNAYYNTFYNAKQLYSEGEREIKRQQQQVSQIELIQIFPEPVNAGSENFEEAINRGSGILRNHENSKFVDRAILIIGKSYFYRSEFFSALEKFQELQVLSEGETELEAVFWQGRTYFQLGNYTEGINYLENQVNSFENADSDIEGSVYAILGQLHTALKNWSSAADYLQAAVNGLQNEEIRARSYYLLGQVFEETEEENRALFAYSRSNELSTDFDLEYNALYKEADVSRRIGSFPRAENIYRYMLRDDKYLEVYNELQYEVARTDQMKGDTESAILNYRLVLDSRIQTVQPVTKAKVYYSMGQIYREHIGDYEMAAAYYDSAANQRVDESEIPFEFNADEMADVFGRYSELQREITDRDSLLRLSDMDSDELDKLVIELQRKEARRIEEELEEVQSDRDRMIVAESQDTVIESTELLENGFLNSNNQVLLADASLQFQAIWGDRPLADNWRRAESVSGSRFDSIVAEESPEEAEILVTTTETPGAGIQPQIDLSHIPFSDEQKEETLREIETFHYQLGNLFFLSLDQPDSAKVYFKKVIDSSYDEELAGMSLYSLAEIALLGNSNDEATDYYEQLREIKPNSLFTNRLSERLGRTDGALNSEEEKTVTVQLNELLETEDMSDEESEVSRAEKIRELADSTNDEELRSRILYQSAREYLRLARVQMNDERIIEQWFERKQEIKDQKIEFNALKDSASVMLNDTTITEDQMQKWRSISDSTFTAPDITDEFPFEGAYWDSTRSLLEAVAGSNSNTDTGTGAKMLLNSIERPKSAADTSSESESEFEKETFPGTDELIYFEQTLCEELGLIPDVEGGLDGFMSRIQFPEWTQNLSMRGEVAYIFVINNKGEIEEFSQISGMDRSGIPQSIEENLEKEFQFLPVDSNENVTCKYIFPINL